MTRARRAKDRLYVCGAVASVAVVMVPLSAVLGSVVVNGVEALDVDFFVRLPLPVGEAGGGVVHAVVGTILLVGGGLVLAVPLGVAAGVFLASNRVRWLASLARLSADVLAGVPSIVTGIFVYGILVLPLGGFSGLAGAVALAIIMLPTITRTTEEVVRMVPSTVSEAAVALGVNKRRTTLGVVVPTAFRGVASGVLTAVARAAGETAPLMFTALGSQFMARSPMEPTAALPLVIFNYAVSPYGDWHTKAWGAALVLTGMVLAANLVARRVTRRG